MACYKNKLRDQIIIKNIFYTAFPFFNQFVGISIFNILPLYWTQVGSPDNRKSWEEESVYQIVKIPRGSLGEEHFEYLDYIKTEQNRRLFLETHIMRSIDEDEVGENTKAADDVKNCKDLDNDNGDDDNTGYDVDSDETGFALAIAKILGFSDLVEGKEQIVDSSRWELFPKTVCRKLTLKPGEKYVAYYKFDLSEED